MDTCSSSQTKILTCSKLLKPLPIYTYTPIFILISCVEGTWAPEDKAPREMPGEIGGWVKVPFGHEDL